MNETSNKADILIKNISNLYLRKEITAEQKNIALDFLAEYVADKLSLTDSKTSPENILHEYCTALSKADIVYFFNSLLNKNKINFSSLEFIDDFELLQVQANVQISYVKNNYNDLAFMRFSSLFGSARVSYGASFDDICEDVYNGISDCCILPIESASDGKLFTFYSLIDKYDLNIFSACDIEDGISGKRTRFALLSRKKFISPSNDNSLILEFSIIADDNYSLSNILDAATICNMQLYRIDSISVPYDEMSLRFYHVFKCDPKGLLPFIIYLTHNHPQHDVIGCYILL